jgi:hypothetical protein
LLVGALLPQTGEPPFRAGTEREGRTHASNCYRRYLRRTRPSKRQRRAGPPRREKFMTEDRKP